MADMLVVRSKIKTCAGDCNVSSDFAGALNEEVGKLIQRASERAKANGRKTIGARDL